ncbi:MAG TPA: 4-phosphopantetheinyl transferase family protein [Planctomycetes bacterium]|nr:4-phosphopantetheinyl transferase family protein [Planctomycetota bacterium]
MIVYPVCARVPSGLRGRRGVDEARRLGHEALELSARLARRPPVEGASFPRDDERAPLPVRTGRCTWHFSTTNTRGLAAAVVAPFRIGIDAEWLDRPRIEAPLAYFDARERARLGLDERRGVIALWSAKEAVLKQVGVGIAGMGRVRLESAAPGHRLRLAFDGERFDVRLFFRGDHVLSIATTEPDCEMRPRSLEAEWVR